MLSFLLCIKYILFAKSRPDRLLPKDKEKYLEFTTDINNVGALVINLDKFVVNLELTVDEICELKIPSAFEKFSTLQIQINLKGIEM